MPLGSYSACFIKDEQANFSGSETFYFDEGGKYDPEDNRGLPRCKTCFGDPVDATTGNKFETHTEFASSASFPLRVEWTYNANGTSEALGAGELIFGRNRSHFYGRRITNSTVDSLQQTLVARPDGKTLRFYKAQDEEWTSDGDDPAKLTLVTELDGISFYRLDDGRGGTERYDLSGRLVQLQTMRGEVQSIEYDQAGRLARVTDRYGRGLRFEYADGRVQRVYQPDGRITSFGYTTNGDLADVTYPDGARTEYRYDEAGYSQAAANSGLLTAVIHDGQRYSSTTYDLQRRATSTWLGAGIDRYDFKYGGTGPVPTTFEVKQPGGGTRYGPIRLMQGAAMPDYVYSGYCAGCSSFRASYKYDQNSNVDAETSGDGTVTDFDYNDRGLLVRKIESANQAATKRTEETSWDPALPVPLERKVLDASGAVVRRTTWTYNARGQALTHSQHDPVTGVARTTTMEYCEQAGVDGGICPLVGLVLSVDGSRADLSDMTSYLYYGSDHPECAASPTTCAWRKGDLWKVTNASGQVTEMLRYDGAGRVLSIKDPNGVVTDLGYDLRGRPAGSTTRAAN